MNHVAVSAVSPPVASFSSIGCQRCPGAGISTSARCVPRPVFAEVTLFSASFKLKGADASMTTITSSGGRTQSIIEPG